MLRGGVGRLGSGSILSTAGRLAGGLALGAGVGAAAGAVGLAVSAGTAGLVNQSRGGSFSEGAQRSLLQAADRAIPLGLSDALGIGQASRTLAGAEGDLNSITNSIARHAGAGAVDPGIRQFLAAQNVEQNRRIQEDRDLNAAAINRNIGGAADPDSFAADFIGAMQSVTDWAKGLLGGASGTAG